MRNSLSPQRLWPAFLPLLLAPCAWAHPMGNFSINHYAAIRIGPQQIELQYVIDMAEIPTFQEMQQSGISGQEQDPRLSSYVTARATQFLDGLQLTLRGKALPLHIVSDNVTFPPGAGNLPTMRLSFISATAIAADHDCERCELNYRDSNFAGRAGWKEIIATHGPGVSFLISSVPAQDRSLGLANYSPELLNSPPQDLEAHVTFLRESFAWQMPGSTKNRLGTSTARQALSRSPSKMIARESPGAVLPKNAAKPVESAKLAASRPSTPRNAFTELMSAREMGLGFLLIAAVIAAGLGALHALEPGHGKTIVAAYLVGSRGTARHAFLLGLIVTASHTAGVYLLGAVTLYAQKYILPEQTYPFLAVLSGVFIAGMGFYLFLQRSVPGALP